jgi:murein DD-endopeptidase MepM/ murein hydrolase activator NlpD
MKLAERTFKRKDSYLTSPFGWRWNPILKRNKFHSGADYGTYLQKWNQYALESGKVISAGKDYLGGGALFAWVAYPRINLKLLYYHLDQVFVKKGQIVDSDTIIGTTGNTGNSTAIHLHLGAKRIDSNVYIDPEPINYIPQDVVVSITDVWDINFTKDLQRYFKTTVDGIISGQLYVHPNVKVIHKGVFGSQLVKAIQISLRMKATGQLDVATIKEMQRKMGTSVDGIVSAKSQLVKEMRKRLEAGVPLW